MLQLHEAGLLSELVLIGGWCPYIYTFIFAETEYIPQLRTADIDILIPEPNSIKNTADLPSVFSDLGYEEMLNYPSGHSHFSHPDLDIEFLISEKGRPKPTPYEIKELKIKAIGLTYLEMLVENIQSVQLPESRFRGRPHMFYINYSCLKDGRIHEKEQKIFRQETNSVNFF